MSRPRGASGHAQQPSNNNAEDEEHTMNLLDTLDLSGEVSAVARLIRRMEMRAALADSEQHSDFAARLLLLVEEMRREGISEISAAELTDVAQAFAEIGDDD